MVALRAAPASVEATTDRREAVRDADYVITTFQQGGLEAYELDIEIPAQLRRGPMRRRHARAGRRLPGTAHHPGPARPLPRHGRTGAARRAAAQLRQPDGDELLGRRSRHRPAARRPVPQRAGHERDAGRLDRRALRGGRLPLRGDQPPGVVPGVPPQQGRTSILACATAIDAPGDHRAGAGARST